MQEPSFILTILLAAVGAGALVIAFRLFSGRKQRKEGQMNSREEILVSSPFPSDSSIDLEHVLTAQESGSVADEVGNEQRGIPVGTLQSSSDSTDLTSTEPQVEIKKDEPETSKVDNIIEKESNIRDIYLDGAIEGTSDIIQMRDDATVLKETPYEESALIEHKQDVTPNQLDMIDQIESGVPLNVSNRLSPEKRGGAHRGQRKTDAREIETSSEKTPRSRKPEVVCWQQYRKWFLGIDIPDDSDLFDLAILQENEKLSKTTDERWMLSSIDSNIEFSSSSLDQKAQIRLAEKDSPYLLFKLTGQNQKWGRRVRYATTGTFLVVVPEMWTRNEELSGVPQVPPTQCHLAGYKAHLFNLDSEIDSLIAFYTTEGNLIKIPNRLSQFELVGTLIEDANEAMGPLFGTSLPKLRCREGLDWENITTVVIGEEGENHSGWRTSFIPNREVAIQDLGEPLQTRQSGWYFIRLYDTNEDLVESLDFRFALTLENIAIAPHSALPGKQGHAVVRIEIHHANNSSIRLIRPLDIQLPTNTNDRGTIVDIPPNPNADKTDWNLLIEKNPKVDLSFLVERVWWSICEQDATPQQNSWTDKSMVLYPPHLVATSKHSLRIRFPRRRWTKEVHVGFEKWRARAYRVEVTRQEVEIPLNHFEGASECEDSSKDHPMKLWINNFAEQTIAIIPHRSETAKKQIRPKHSISIRYNKKRLLKYLSRLDHTAKNPTFSEMLKECKQNWSSSDVKEKRDDCLIRTACLIKIRWGIMKSRGMKPIGRRRGWVRSLIKVAEAHPDYLANITDKYEILIRNDEDSTLLSARTNTR